VLYCQFPVEPSKFFKAQTALADGAVFQVGNDRNGTGVAVITVTLKGVWLEPWLGAKDFGKDAALQAFFLLFRSCYADACRLQCFGTER